MKIIYAALILVSACLVFGKLYKKTDKMQAAAWTDSLLDTVESPQPSLVECGTYCESLPDCNAFRLDKKSPKCEMAKLTALSETETDKVPMHSGKYCQFLAHNKIKILYIQIFGSKK